MKTVKEYGQNYVNWVLRLGRIRAALFGLFVLAVFAILVQSLLNFIFTGKIYLNDIFRSIVFGLISAPLVIYFFNLIVEKLERSRRRLAQSLSDLSLLQEHDSQLNVELEQKAEFLRSFINASPDLVFYRSETGYFLGCNHAVEILTGKSEQELILLTPHDLYPAETAKLILDTDRDTLISNTGVTYEQWFNYPNGKRACFEIRKVPYYDRLQNRHCIMGFGRDITERKRYQEVIEKNSRDKTTLMATISHELRTPLNGIIGLSQILLEENLSPQQREYLKTINISAISLGHIFSDIIDLEKIDSRRIKLFYTEVEFSQLISNISHFAKLMAEQKKIKFHMHYPDNLPDFIYIDNARLSQILWNLFNNAVKFTPMGGEISLEITSHASNYFNFILKDTGIGIAKSEQRKIFAMFYQAENAQAKKAQGSGIGLAISKRIARLMGGDLTVESELNQGSTFTLTIQANSTTPQKTIQITPHALRVLLVEDMEVNIIVAKTMLEKFGCDVDVAMNGAEAFQLFEQGSYDLILLDIQLPDTTGFAIAAELRKRYQREEIDCLPLLIALTANVIQTKMEYQQQGMDDVLRKPLSLEALSSCLNRHFNDEQWQNKTFIPTTTEVTTDQHLPIDQTLLFELISVIGKAQTLNSMNLLSQLMPNYLDRLKQFHTQWCSTADPAFKKATQDEAHKIKGACATVGLIDMQQIAQQAQTETGQHWEDNIADWIAQIDQNWQAHLHQAMDYVHNFTTEEKK